MAFIPADAKWFVADLVVAIRVGSREQVTVHVNSTLIRADSPREARARALALGKEQAELRYDNAAGEKVRFRFLGLSELSVVHDDLGHGCELRYTAIRRRTMAQARALVTPRARLAVFRPRVPSQSPDYMDGDLRRQIEAIFGPQRRAGRPRNKAGGRARTRKRD